MFRHLTEPRLDCPAKLSLSNRGVITYTTAWLFSSCFLRRHSTTAASQICFIAFALTWFCQYHDVLFAIEKVSYYAMITFQKGGVDYSSILGENLSTCLFNINALEQWKLNYKWPLRLLCATLLQLPYNPIVFQQSLQQMLTEYIRLSPLRPTPRITGQQATPTTYGETLRLSRASTRRNKPMSQLWKSRPSILY